MSSTYPSTSPPVDPHSSRDVDDLGLNYQPPTTQFGWNLLSPYTHSQTLSNTASPSYTPGESGYSSNYQSSEFDEPDPFFGMNYDEFGVQRIDSIPTRPIRGNPAYPTTSYQSADLNRPLPDLPADFESQPTSASFSNVRYPISPINSSIHNTPSPNGAINDIKNLATVFQQELFNNGFHNEIFQNTQSLAPTIASIQLTPDQSGSSHTSAEGLDPSTMPSRPEHSPRVMVSDWEDGQHQNRSCSFDQSNQQYCATNSRTFGGPLPVQQPGQHSQTSVQRDENGSWRTNDLTGQRGLDPETRKVVSNVEIPSLKEEEVKRKILHKNSQVEEWRSQAGGSSDTEDEQPSQSYFPLSHEDWYIKGDPGSRRTNDEIENDIPPLDDGASIHENRLVEGQTYFDFSSPQINEVDKAELMNHPRVWKDTPSVPYITTGSNQPQTANEAIQKYHSQADNISLISRQATWGTTRRRKSEPSLADAQGVSDGSFLKKLSISSSKGRDENRPRQNSLLDQGIDRLANFTRKRSNSKLKRVRSHQNIPEEPEAPHCARHNSQDTLAPPKRTPSFSKRQTPSINTAFVAMAGPLAAVGTAHARRTSVGATTTSPKSPIHLGFAANIIKRARSRSELTSQEKAGKTGLADLWRNSGGPPVLAATPNQVEASLPHQDTHDRDEDDDEEDEVDENDPKMEPEQQADPIDPTYDGFKAHVRRLNPDMDPRHKWLVSRIAHQQEIRYKNLLDLRVKHSQAINARNCSAAVRCLSLGGSVVLTDAKGNPREPDQTPSGLHLVTDFSDNDSNPGEGHLEDDSFPQGVPMPPTKNLPAEFECQLCFKSKKFQKPSDWTKHVHEDVQPFTCTYDKCKEPKSFKRKADWVRHENERHRHLEWWICQVDDCRHPCYRKDNFLQHLVREHKLPEPKQKTKAAIKKARLTEPAWIMLERCHHETTSKPQDEPCKFCGKSFPTWKKLTVHLAKHMEHISLPILRLVEAKTVDANTIISPVGEQILTPVTPLSRAKMESSHSPFNMDSISPHVPTVSQFASTGYEQPSLYFQTANPSAGHGLQRSMQQEVHYTSNNNNHYNNHNNQMYPGTFSVQPMDQSRSFNDMNSNNNMGHMNQTRNFGSLDSSFSQSKVEPTCNFGSIDYGFSHAVPNQNYNMQQTSGYPIPQRFSTAPPVSGYQTPNMLGVSEPGFGFDPMAVTNNQNFPQVPMSRAHGSASSYGHSPQNAPQMPYYGHQG